MGWYYGFKLHMIINNKGHIMTVKITPANIDDQKTLDTLTKGLKGKLLAVKGYIGKNVFAKLYKRGLHLIMGIRKNMRNYLMPLVNKLLLRKRFIIETVFGKFKSNHLFHSRHRSAVNAFVSLLSCLTAYQFDENKPSIKFWHFLIQN